MAGEAYVEDGRLDAVVLHDIYYLRNERPRLPGKGTARLKDDAQVRIVLVQSLEQADEVLGVVVGTCDEVAAAQVEPFHLAEPGAELRLDVLERMLKGKTTAFAMAVAVETLNAFGQDGR